MRHGSSGTRRPAIVNAAVGALGFVGATAIAGGVEMVLFPDGNRFVRAEWIEHVPLIESWRLPGLVLGLGLGVGSAVTAFGLARRTSLRSMRGVERLTGRHWSWAATVTLGAGLGGWILLEVAWIPERSAIEALYGGLAALLLAATRTNAMRDHLAAPADADTSPTRTRR